jgi:hypothetical protein
MVFWDAGNCFDRFMMLGINIQALGECDGNRPKIGYDGPSLASFNQSLRDIYAATRLVKCPKDKIRCI